LLSKLNEDEYGEYSVMFYQAILPMFTHINLLLQKDEPMIPKIQDTLFSLIKKTLEKFVKPELATNQ